MLLFISVKLNNATTENVVLKDTIQGFQETFENTTENLRQKLEQCECMLIFTCIIDVYDVLLIFISVEVNLLKNKIFEIEKAKQMQNKTEGMLMSQNSKEGIV